MRCPKCHYISFDDSQRCRNCGYEFSLAVDVPKLDLPIQTGDEPVGPFSDFELGDHVDHRAGLTDGGSSSRSASARPSDGDLQSRGTFANATDLPLFNDARLTTMRRS